MVYAISYQDLPFRHKKKGQQLVAVGMVKLKKICNTAIAPSQICDSTVAVLQIQKKLFYSLHCLICMVYSSTVAIL